MNDKDKPQQQQRKQDETKPETKAETGKDDAPKLGKLRDEVAQLDGQIAARQVSTPTSDELRELRRLTQSLLELLGGGKKTDG
jgi:hypothetical protein